jgi:hypothetical protein
MGESSGREDGREFCCPFYREREGRRRVCQGELQCGAGCLQDPSLAMLPERILREGVMERRNEGRKRKHEVH